MGIYLDGDSNRSLVIGASRLPMELLITEINWLVLSG